MELNVRCLQLGAGLEEAGGEAGGHGHGAGAEHHVLEADPHLVVEAAHFVVQGRLVALVDQARLQVVLQVLPDTRQVGQHVDAVLLQLGGLADTGEHEDLRGSDGAGGEDHLALGADHLLPPALVEIGNPDRPPAFDHHPGDVRPRDDLQVRALLDRIEIGHRRRAAPTLAGRQLEVADPFLFGAVVVRVVGVAGILRGCDPGIADRPLEAHVRHRERPAGAVVVVGAALLILRPLEQGQHVVPAPARIAHLAPAVVVLMLTAHVKQAVERGGAAQHLAARPVETAAVQARIRLGHVAPVDTGVVHGFEVADRDVDPGIDVAPPGLQQHDPRRRIGAQSIGQNATRRSCTDYDIIGLRYNHLVRFLPIYLFIP